MAESEESGVLFPIFILTIIAIPLVPYTFVKLSRAFSKKQRSIHCQCLDCDRSGKYKRSLSQRVSSFTSCSNLTVVLLWFVVIFLISYTKNISRESQLFEPFSILGLEPGASDSQIKKAYRKLSIQYHPDKNPDPEANKYFVESIAKAYQALTDPLSRENFEKYGHPDGRQGYKLGIALPQFILDLNGESGGLLLLFTVGFCILLPLVVASIYLWRSSKYTGNYVKLQTRQAYYELMKPSLTTSKVMEIFIKAAEYTEIPVRKTDDDTLKKLFTSVKSELSLDPKKMKQDEAKFWKQDPAVSKIQTLKTGILKVFDNIQKYDDGTFYFDESEGPISTTASVIRGLTSLAASDSTGLNLPGDKIVGLAKFFLGVGIPGDAKDFFNQIDALACLEDNRFSVPLILSLPSTVISLTKKEPLKVKVSTVLGSKAPALSVKLVQALSSGSKSSSVINNQELKFDAVSATYFLDSFPKNFDVGKYTFVFEILLDESANEKAYVTEAQTKVPVAATGAITIEDAEIAVLDSDVGSVESQKKLDLTKDGAVSLSANHLQKLRLSLQLTTPLGHVFKPHQAFLKLKHESQVEHIFLVKTSGKKSELVLDFLGLVEKLYYLSGKYEIQLTIGDASMENSLLSNIGHIELDLPQRPEKAAIPPLQPTDPYSRYGPKAEISHIFRVPEKLPAKQLSLVFLGLIVLPFIGFLIGLTRLGVNIKSFPSSVGAATSALLFHGGIGAVLLLYVLFWVKLDLFTTLKALSLLGVFLLFVGHRTLSHLAAASNKLKSA